MSETHVSKLYACAHRVQESRLAVREGVQKEAAGLFPL